jgi:hypothetical protein
MASEGRKERMGKEVSDVAGLIYAGTFGHVYAPFGSRRHVLGFVDWAKQARTYISRDFIKNPPTLFFPHPPPSRCCVCLLHLVVTLGQCDNEVKGASVDLRSVFKHPSYP